MSDEKTTIDQGPDVVEIFTEHFVQNRIYYSTKWSVFTIDMALGLIGGLVALIWQLIELLFGDY